MLEDLSTSVSTKRCTPTCIGNWHVRAWSKSKLHGNEGKYRQDDDCAVAEVDLRQLRGDVMDMIVQFLRWDRAETERGCYGVILLILMVAASART